MLRAQCGAAVDATVPKLHVFAAAACKEGEQQCYHCGHQQPQQHAYPHVAPLGLYLD